MRTAAVNERRRVSVDHTRTRRTLLLVPVVHAWGGPDSAESSTQRIERVSGGRPPACPVLTENEVAQHEAILRVVVYGDSRPLWMIREAVLRGEES